jgi:Zn-dependent alcohol dehydrogenase
MKTNYLLSCNVSVVENNITFNDKFDLQPVSCVGDFLISKFKNDCGGCQKCLFAKKTDIQHIFTLYKEHDKSKLKLKYIREELCVCVAKIYDLSVYYLNKFVEVNYIGKKLRIALEQKIVGCSNQFDHQKHKKRI